MRFHACLPRPYRHSFEAFDFPRVCLRNFFFYLAKNICISPSHVLNVFGGPMHGLVLSALKPVTSHLQVFRVPTSVLKDVFHRAQNICNFSLPVFLQNHARLLLSRPLTAYLPNFRLSSSQACTSRNFHPAQKM